MDIYGNYARRIKSWVLKQLHTDHQNAAAESASFKEVNIAVNEAYKQGALIILRILSLSTFVGVDAGKNTLAAADNNFFGYRAGYLNTDGYFNNFFGYKAGYSNTSGFINDFFGYEAGYANTTGNRNIFFGYGTGHANTTGYLNTFLGAAAGYSNTNGYLNAFFGYGAGYANTSGHNNVYFGFFAGGGNISGNGNVSIGYRAGSFETGNYKLFIDGIIRTNEADGRIKALIYGIFDAATANQLVRLNAILELTEIKSGATQAGAGAGANEVWKTNAHASLPDNVLMIGV